MKTTEKQKTIFNKGNNLEIHKRNDFPDELNEERIISKYKPREIIYYYDNSAISLSYGQYNIEKCLIVLTIILLLNLVIIYNYYPKFTRFVLISIIGSMAVDATISLLFLYFLYKLKSNIKFNKIYGLNSLDILITLNFVMKSILFIIMLVHNKTVVAIILLSVKFLVDFYFILLSVKILMFCPCSVYLLEFTEKIWTTLKKYLFCYDKENTATDPENYEYSKLEDIESFY
jgi:hypothetical protein